MADQWWERGPQRVSAPPPTAPQRSGTGPPTQRPPTAPPATPSERPHGGLPLALAGILIVLAGVIGAAVDVSSGAMYDLTPATVNFHLRKNQDG